MGGGGKLSPRQKMINVMYLFLTCMLALNVSKDVLNAFININDRLIDTNENFISNNRIAYDALTQAYLSNQQNPNYINAYNAANRLKEKSDSLVQSIQYYKDTIIIYADQIKPADRFTRPGEIGYFRFREKEGDTIRLERDVVSKDNKSIPAQIMVGQEANPGKARELKAEIDSYRDWLIKTAVDFGADSTSSFASGIRGTFNTDRIRGTGHESGMISWESRNFEHLPLMAVITIMTQMQAAVRNTEGDMLNLMLGSLDAGTFRFNRLEPIVQANSNYVMQGSEYTAQIFLAAFDTTQAPIVEIGRVQRDENGNLFIQNPDIVPVDNVGRGILTRRGTALGPQKYEGLIKVLRPGTTDEYISYKFEGDYQVAQPSVVISPTKMNVFYIGPDNPVQISVPGVPGDRITATLSPSTHGTITRVRGDEYVVRVTRPGRCEIQVTAEIAGRRQSMGASEFRIRRVPDPVATILGKEGGNITRGELQAANRVEAKMKDFDFDLTFTVQSFRVTARVGQYFVEEASNSDRITHQMKQSIFNQLNRGARLYFENVVARGPDGRDRNLGVLSFTVQ